MKKCPKCGLMEPNDNCVICESCLTPLTVIKKEKEEEKKKGKRK